MDNFTVPDICDEYENIQIGDLFLKSFGSKNKFYGQIQTVECEHSNSVVKELVEEKGEGKVLLINHTGDELCSWLEIKLLKRLLKITGPQSSLMAILEMSRL